jgi:3-methyladenine DNA glycosylase AlkD
MLKSHITDCKKITGQLKKLANARNVEGMARFGITARNTLGVNIPVLRKIARAHRNDHNLALQLWKTDIHEARLLAGFIDDPALVTEKQIEAWVRDFDSWDICDMVCGNLFDKTPFAYAKAEVWPDRDEEYVKRAGFVMMAVLSVHDKKAPDSVFMKFLHVIKREARDERNFVKKAVNWALRQIGKRNLRLNRMAVKAAKDIKKIDSRSARWIASDAIRELTNKATLARVSKK